MDEKLEKRKMTWDMHEEVKLVQEVNHEVGFRGEAMHNESNNQ